MVWTLHHEQGVGKKRIARLLGIDPKTVRRFIEHRGQLPRRESPDRVALDEAELRVLHDRCAGYVQRMYEILTEERGVDVGYSTLTRRCRELGLGEDSSRLLSADAELIVRPGVEMQHDTSPYTLTIGGRRRGVIASGLYFRFAKARYLKFSLSFDRFAMKSFFHEALTFWKHVAPRCVIDNTNLAVLHGTGKNAVFNPEMIAFARRYGFEWMAHELRHSDRKAGQERTFWSVETNFFPGRTFASLDDLNEQARAWATERMFRKPHDKTKLVPAELWETEKPLLVAVPIGLSPPERDYRRLTDRKGYVSLGGNYYFVPGSHPRERVEIVEDPTRLRIFRSHECVADYPLASADVRGRKERPPGLPAVPERPQNDRQGSDDEARRLRALGLPAQLYLDWLAANPSRVRYRHRFIQELYSLSTRLTPVVFQAALDQARTYGIVEIDSIERIVSLLLRSSSSSIGDEIGALDSSDEYRSRPTYQEGRFSEEVDLSSFDRLLRPPKKDRDGEDEPR